MKKVLLTVFVLLFAVLFSVSTSSSNPRLIIEHSGPADHNIWIVRVSYPAPGIVECIAFGPNDHPISQNRWEHFPPESTGQIMVPDVRMVHTTRCNFSPPPGRGPGPFRPGPHNPPGPPPW